MKARFKKSILLLSLCMASVYNAFACGPDYDPDCEYYNLFLQEIIDDPQYAPFLVTLSAPFYETKGNTVRNENIEQWQDYFGISYDEAYHLVFKAQENEIRALIKGGGTTDPELRFITPSFRKKYKGALEYLVYAKYLEPYMYVIPGESWYYSKPPASVTDLDYREVTSALEERWKKTRDKELKLRYGYQLVRLAHYSRHYGEAIAYFDKYVEVLNFKPAMYYHALSQKAGAERGSGDLSLANYHFLQVFSHSKNLKETAVTSIRLNENADWQELVHYAQDQNELNDAYLLLGFNTFNNPLNEIKKIAENTPDAIQAKVLMVRAINLIEREDLALEDYWYYGEREVKSMGDKRYPRAFSVSNEILDFSDAMTKNPGVKDRNFWLLTSAYLHFLRKDFVQARSYLDRVGEVNAKYTLQKRNLSFYIDISEPPVITPQLETVFYEKYKVLLTENEPPAPREDDWYCYGPGTTDFVKDVWANRYFLQKEYAKSFLLNHPVTDLEQYPRLDLLDALEAFYRKPDKNPLEEQIAGNFFPLKGGSRDVESYLNYIRGIVYLTKGELSLAHSAFRSMKPEARTEKVPGYILGANIIECMSCRPDTVMENEHLPGFPFIGEEMDFEELTAVLLKLKETGEKNNSLSAKANYLLGNFFYNISAMGYFRHVPRFQEDNYNSYKYYIYKEPDIYSDIYFKYYPTYYENSFPQSQKYLEKAYRQTAGRELKARIAFALSKCEQEAYVTDRQIRTYYWNDGNGVLISDRHYFKELMKYRNTDYFKEVESKCKYFEYYVAKSDRLH